jgi:hypothetical protein
VTSPTEPEPSDWRPYRLEEHPPRNRPTLALLNTFNTAFYGGQIPRACWRSTGVDYEAGQLVITIYPDDQAFRAAVARILPATTYRVVVDNVQGIGVQGIG